jgi:hypothetical protein
MADNTTNANRFARDPRITAAAASSMNAWKPLMLFQVSMLGMRIEDTRGLGRGVRSLRNARPVRGVKQPTSNWRLHHGLEPGRR